MKGKIEDEVRRENGGEYRGGAGGKGIQVLILNKIRKCKQLLKESTELGGKCGGGSGRRQRGDGR